MKRVKTSKGDYLANEGGIRIERYNGDARLERGWRGDSPTGKYDKGPSGWKGEGFQNGMRGAELEKDMN